MVEESIIFRDFYVFFVLELKGHLPNHRQIATAFLL